MPSPSVVWVSIITCEDIIIKLNLLSKVLSDCENNCYSGNSACANMMFHNESTRVGFL